MYITEFPSREKLSMGTTGAAQQMVDNAVVSPLDILNTELQDMGREVATVPDDGHCLLHAVAESTKKKASRSSQQTRCAQS